MFFLGLKITAEENLQRHGATDMISTIIRFAKSTTAVEAGFIAAGLTVSIAAVVGTLLKVF